MRGSPVGSEQLVQIAGGQVVDDRSVGVHAPRAGGHTHGHPPKEALDLTGIGGTVDLGLRAGQKAAQDIGIGVLADAQSETLGLAGARGTQKALERGLPCVVGLAVGDEENWWQICIRG